MARLYTGWSELFAGMKSEIQTSLRHLFYFELDLDLSLVPVIKFLVEMV